MPLQRTSLQGLVRRSGPRNILLCLDAFGTLIRPRRPIPDQYVQVAEQCGLMGITPAQVQATFRAAFKHESKKNPNYGKATSLGATKWWTNVINNTFTPLLKPGQDMPKELAPRLLHRFSSDEGYELAEPKLPETLRLLQDGNQNANWNLVVCVVSNCDDRIIDIMKSLGLRVGPLRYSHLAVLRPTGDSETSQQLLGSSSWREAAELLEDVVSRRRRQTSPMTYQSLVFSNADATPPAAAHADTNATQDQSNRYDLDFTLMSYDVGHEKPDPRIFVSAQEMGNLVLAPSLRQPLQSPRVSPSNNHDEVAESGVQVDRLESICADKPWLDWIKVMVGDDIKTDAAGALSQSCGFWNCFILDPDGNHKPVRDQEPSEAGLRISQHMAEMDHHHQTRSGLLQAMGQNQLSFDHPKERFLMRIDSVSDLIMRIRDGMKQPPETIPQSLLKKLGQCVSS